MADFLYQVGSSGGVRRGLGGQKQGGQELVCGGAGSSLWTDRKVGSI